MFGPSLESIKHPAQVLRMGSKSVPKRAGKGLLSWLCCVSSQYKMVEVVHSAELNADARCSPSGLQHTAVGTWGLQVSQLE